MKFEIDRYLEDRKTDSLSVSATTTIGDYVEWFKEYGAENKLDEQRNVMQTRTSRMIRTRLISDIGVGAVIPPIVIGLCVKSIKRERIDNDYLKKIIDNELKDSSVIDGMQRSAAIIKAYDDNHDICNNKIRLEFWIADGDSAVNKLIYRMLVLNTGQVPWDIKRQLEVINKPLIKALKSCVPDAEIYVKNDTSRRTTGGEYQSSYVIEIYLAFNARKEDINLSDNTTDSFIKLDVSDMAGDVKNWEIFSESFKMLVEFDKLLSGIKTQNCQTQKYKEGGDIFKTLPSEIGFMVALSVYVKGDVGTSEPLEEEQKSRMDSLKQNFDMLKNKINTLEDGEKYDFLCLDTLEERINGLPTKKIGQAQREFFKKAFAKLIEKEFRIDNMDVLWRV
ncbi:MAG: hypothetical protein IKP37_04515 [Paludibacteraceae bacterium]|nr:hypothetical protein [Paludibacteraceae bacterium]